MAGLIILERLPDHADIYLIRGCEEYGMPYDMVCTAVINGDTVVIKGMHGTFTTPARRALREALIELGCKRAIFERYRKNGAVTKHEVIYDGGI